MRSSKLYQSLFLHNQDVISSQISDHYPVIHDDILFWNIMMKGKPNNNAFALVESNNDYHRRLIKVSHMIAKIIAHNPSIKVITLCEGPIDSIGLLLMCNVLKQYPHMKRFFSKDSVGHSFHKPFMQGYNEWGLLMLAEQSYKVRPLQMKQEVSLHGKLANRLQIWELSKAGEKCFITLAHFPLGKDVFVTKKENLSLETFLYIGIVESILKKYADERLIICADFNFNPYLISHYKDRVLDRIANHNSLFLLNQESADCKAERTMVTVDGVLLTNHEKQRYTDTHYTLGLFSKLTRERRLFNEYSENIRDESDEMQNQHRQRLALTF